MLKYRSWLLCLSLFCSVLDISAKQLKVLHLSFHLGCIKDFEVVAQALDLDLTSWYILENKESRDKLDNVGKWNSIYNIGHARAKRMWERNKKYFNQFDVIVTSDTVALSRIFLQNNWQKPLIIWMCNRFDYSDPEDSGDNFPDQEYYDLIRKAAHQKNVKLVGYVAYEHFYAAQGRGVDTGNCIIKPCGSLESAPRNGGASAIPASVNKEETFFIIPRLKPDQVANLVNKCDQLGIKTYCGPYNGPYDLKDFKGIIHLPYQWSNLALFENIQLGLPHFIPSPAFARELSRSRDHEKYRFIKGYKGGAFRHIELSEWYCSEHKEIMVYFDSWQDLQYKINTIDFPALKERIKNFALAHRQEMLSRWHSVFRDVGAFKN